MNGPAQPPPVVPGALLAGRYRVERVLGQGAMGVVVAARHVDLGELFAVKLLLPQAVAIPLAVDRFLREARAAARLKSEHAVKVTDVGRLEDGSPYMVMEHLAGTDLQQLVRSRGPLPIEEAATYIVQACDAIAEAHSLGIVHRDLKPSNLFLIRRRNGSPCVKVLDFGISKQVVQEAVDLTKTGDVFGTPLYMAPEQMAQSKNADARSDIWSMGIVLHELLTGATPFHATTITEVVARVLQEEAPPPSTRRAGIPPALDAIVVRCLQKRPDHRFQTIDELTAALHSVEGVTSPLLPRSPSAPDSRAPFAAQPLPTRADPSIGVPANAGSSPNTVVPPTLVHKGREVAPGAASGATPIGAPAATASSWGTDGRARAGSSGVLVVSLATGGLLAAVLAAGGIWVALRSPAAVAADPPPELVLSTVQPTSPAPAPVQPSTTVAPAAEPPASVTVPPTVPSAPVDPSVAVTASTSPGPRKPVATTNAPVGKTVPAKPASAATAKAGPSRSPSPPAKTSDGPW